MQIATVERPFGTPDKRPVIVIASAAPAVPVYEKIRSITGCLLHCPGHALSEFIVGYKERPLRCKERANCIHVDTKAANLVLLGCWVGRRYGAIRYAMFTPEVFDESVADRKGGVGGQCIARPEKHVDMVGLKLVIDVERAVVGTERRGNQSRECAVALAPTIARMIQRRSGIIVYCCYPVVLLRPLNCFALILLV